MKERGGFLPVAFRVPGDSTPLSAYVKKKKREPQTTKGILNVKVETDGWIKIPAEILEEVQLHEGSEVAIKIHFRGTMGSYLVLYPADEEL